MTLGGSDEPSNLVCACVGCNAGKASIAPDSAIVEDVSSLALQWRAAIEEVVRAYLDERQEVDGYLEEFEESWDQWHTKDGEIPPREKGWRESVERWLALGLPLYEIIRLVRVAMEKDDLRSTERWKYYCACCWRALTRFQDDAFVLFEKKVNQ